MELKASGSRGNGSFFNIVSKVLEIEVPYLLAMGKFIGAQMSEIVADREQRSVESHARMALSFYPYFDSGDRFRLDFPLPFAPVITLSLRIGTMSFRKDR